MVVNVTPSHISSGDKWEQRSCPVARALESVGLQKPKARYQGYNAVVNGTLVMGSFPSPVGKFMEDFDYGRDVKPFSFEITPRPVET